MPARPTVYIVDDDPGALESLRWLVEQAEFPVKAFRSGLAFLDAYREEDAGCLVLDVRMPDMDGLMLQEAIRERKIRLPIIFITAYGDVPTCAARFAPGPPTSSKSRSTTRCCWATSAGSWPPPSRSAAITAAGISANA